MIRVFILYFCLLGTPVLAQQSQSFTETPLFPNGSDGYACYRIPAVIRAPNDDLLAFAEGRKNGCSDFGNVDIVLKISRDQGRSWSPLQVAVDNGILQAGNPAPVVDLLDPAYPQGRIFLFYNTGNNHEGEIRQGKGLREIWYITSIDNGRSWSKPVNITVFVHRPKQPKANPAYNFKEDWRSYALTPGHAIQLQQAPYRGRLFVPANHSAGEPIDGFNEYRAHAFFSDDHGRTWRLSEEVPAPSSNESIAVELSDGRIMQNIRQQNGEKRQRLIALSNDGGQSWDTTYFEAQLPGPVCQASILDYITPAQQRVLLFSNPANQEKRENMTVRISFDDGQTWLLSREVRPGASAYSDLVALTNGDIGLLYEHGNNGGIHFAQFNYPWLTGAKDHTDHPFVQKLVNPHQYATDFQFQLAGPAIEADQVFFQDRNEVKLKLDLAGVRIHYTLDGTEPTEQSPRYDRPIILTESAQLQARAYHDLARPSGIVSAKLVQAGKKLPVKDIQLTHPPDPNYPGDGAKVLTDRQKGSANFREKAWLGFSGDDIEVTLIFSKKISFTQVTASLLANPGAWIFLPQAMEVSVSKDGRQFTKVAEKAFDPPTERMSTGPAFLEVHSPAYKTRYLRVILKNLATIPDWHPGKGTPAWLFIDELLIK